MKINRYRFNRDSFKTSKLNENNTNANVNGEIIGHIKNLILFLLVVSVVSIIVNVLTDGKGTVCLFANTTGVPCPTCGLTRSVLYTLKLDFKTAFMYNPLIFIMPFGLLVYIYGVIRENKKIINGSIYIIGAVAIIIWIVRMFLYFPNVEPMIYRENSLFGFLFGLVKGNLF